LIIIGTVGGKEWGKRENTKKTQKRKNTSREVKKENKGEDRTPLPPNHRFRAQAAAKLGTMRHLVRGRNIGGRDKKEKQATSFHLGRPAMTDI